MSTAEGRQRTSGLDWWGVTRAAVFVCALVIGWVTLADWTAGLAALAVGPTSERFLGWLPLGGAFVFAAIAMWWQPQPWERRLDSPRDWVLRAAQLVMLAWLGWGASLMPGRLNTSRDALRSTLGDAGSDFATGALWTTYWLLVLMAWALVTAFSLSRRTTWFGRWLLEGGPGRFVAVTAGPPYLLLLALLLTRII